MEYNTVKMQLYHTYSNNTLLGRLKHQDRIKFHFYLPLSGSKLENSVFYTEAA